MIVTGVTSEQLRNAVDALNTSAYAGNLTLSVGREYSRNRFSCRVIPAESGARMFPRSSRQSAPGARKSWNGRRINAACWHAYRDVIAAVFAINPAARVYTSMSKYVGAQGFIDNYPATANRNIGSMAQPAYMPELCDCDHYGIDTREQG